MSHKKHFKIAVLLTFGAAFLFCPPFVNGADYDAEINALNAKIKAQQDQISAIQKRQQTYSSLIAQKREEQSSLNNQLSILENRVSKAQLDLDETKGQIVETELITKNFARVTYTPDSFVEEKVL